MSSWAWGPVVKYGIADCSQEPKHPQWFCLDARSQLLVRRSPFLARHSFGKCSNAKLYTMAAGALEWRQWQPRSWCAAVAEVQQPVGPKLHGAGRRRHDALTSQFAISRLLGDTMSVAEVQPTVGQTEAWAGGG